MKIFCCILAILVLVSSVSCLYIQDPNGIPRIQALARVGERPSAAVPGQKTVIITGNSAQPSQYRTYVDPNPAYGAYGTYGTYGSGTNPMARGSTVVINVAEDPDPYYSAAVPARTIRL